MDDKEAHSNAETTTNTTSDPEADEPKAGARPELTSEVIEMLRKAALSDDPEAQAAAMKLIQSSTAAAAPQQGADSEQEVPPIDWTTEPAPTFANGLQVMHRPTEFSLILTDMTPFPGRRSPDGKAGNERAVVVGSYRIHPENFFQMLCVMASNWNRFATTMIDPRMRQPRFKLLDAGDLQLEGIQKPSDQD